MRCRRWLADLVDTVRVKGDVILDLRHCFEWGFIAPYGIEGAIPAGWNAVIGSVPLIGAIGRVFAMHEGGHINIAARDILYRWIRGLAKYQRFASVCNNPSADRDDDP